MSDLQSKNTMNLGVMTNEELTILKGSTFAIVGLGGIGGHLANLIVRLGARNLILIDFDRFTETNLNRQLFCTIDSLKQYKVDVVASELKRLDPDLVITTHKKRVQDLDSIQSDYIMDCVDNPETKIYLSKLSKSLNIPLLHGSCGGWYGQVGWISPSCSLIEDMYSSEEQGLEAQLLNPSFAPSVVASFMASEVAKMIKGSTDVTMDELVLIDLRNNSLLRTGGE